MRARSVAVAALVLVALAACREPTSGPVRIAWGRDACEHCGMAIMDRRFATEVRAARHVARFDEVGCAVLWMAEHGDGDVTEIWTMDAAREQWIPARTAFYRSGQATPMSYGFAAVSDGAAGDTDFETTRKIILEREATRERRRDRSADADPHP